MPRRDSAARGALLCGRDERPAAVATSIAAASIAAATLAVPSSNVRYVSVSSSVHAAASIAPSNSCTNPVSPAAGSACPMLAFTPPTASGVHDARRTASTAALSDPASIGSPSAVPVP